MAEFLAESHQIQQLDLRQNEVKFGGLMALCLALRINRSLASLDLDHILPQEQVGAAVVLTDLNPALKSDFLPERTKRFCLSFTHSHSLTLDARYWPALRD